MKLYAVFVGGDHPRANIEVHDMRVVVAESLEATIPALRAAWWGRPSSLHIDGYAELTEIDGWQVDLVPGPAPVSEPSPPPRRLWFVNLGGYTPALLGEQHNYLFLAGETKAEVWSRARALSPEWTSRHKDNFISIDALIDVASLLEAEGWHLRLEKPATGSHPSRMVSDYIKL